MLPYITRWLIIAMICFLFPTASSSSACPLCCIQGVHVVPQPVVPTWLGLQHRYWIKMTHLLLSGCFRLCSTAQSWSIPDLLPSLRNYSNLSLPVHSHCRQDASGFWASLWLFEVEMEVQISADPCWSRFWTVKSRLTLIRCAEIIWLWWTVPW